MRSAIGKSSRSQKAAILAGGALVAAVTLVLLFGSQARTLVSFKKVEGAPLYVMHFYGSYGLDEFLKTGVDDSSDSRTTRPLGGSPWACTVFAALSHAGEPVLGRSFDWHNQYALLLFTHPPGGYDSVSLVDSSYVGLDGSAPSPTELLQVLDAPYWPFDGMNEHGLAVGMMAVPHAEDDSDPQRATIGSLHAIRLVLDHARTVDEAIALLDDYNVDFSGGPPLHYLIADAQRNAAVIEFSEGRMNALRNEEPWQVATNFLLSSHNPRDAKQLCPRYARAYDTLQQAGGMLSPTQAMAVLADVSQPNTMWSVVYGLSSGDVSLSMDRDYSQVHAFSLPVQSP
jgi:choloylglycine hydrolase